MLLPTVYEDAGISGGTLERPGLQRLLADIDAGLVDQIVNVRGRNEGRPPRLDLGTEAALQSFTREAASRGLMHSAHDLSDGGLGVAIAESLFGPLGETMGATIALETPRRADGVLFSETQSRILTSVPAAAAEAFLALAEEHGVPVQRIGVVGGDKLEIRVNGASAISTNVDDLREVWWNAIEKGL